MSRNRLFRPLVAHDRQTVSATRRRATQRRALVARLQQLRERRIAGTLTDDDVRLLARLGPHTQRLVGYTPRVTLT